MGLPTSAVFLLPRYSNRPYEQHTLCVFSLMEVLSQNRIPSVPISLRRCSQIDKARSILASQVVAMQQRPEVAICLDDDIDVDPQAFFRTISECSEEQPIVGVPYAKKRRGSCDIAGRFTEEVEEVGFFESGKVYPAAWVDCGCTVIHTSLLVKMAEQMEQVLTSIDGKAARIYPFYDKAMRPGQLWDGEGRAFCERARELCGDVRMALDTRPVVQHYGDYGFTLWDAFDTAERPKQVTIELKPKAPEAAPKETEDEPEDSKPHPQSGHPGVTTTREPAVFPEDAAKSAE